MDHKPIYLDYCSTTPVDPHVLEEMLPYFTDHFGNSSSKTHSYGWLAEEAVELASSRMGSLLEVNTNEVVFTSGATESVNLAIKGVLQLYHTKGRHIISAKTEHRAVLDCLEWAEKNGAEVSWLSVSKDGKIDLEELSDAIRKDTILVALMWANNETGVIHPMAKIGKICREAGVLLFSDATQAVGKIEVLPKSSMVDLVAFSAHKFYGPKGVGGLYVSSNNPRVKLSPQIHGGGHQSNLRSGTLNVAGIVGMGKAAEVAKQSMLGEAQRLKKLRNLLELSVLKYIPESKIFGDTQNRLPHVTNIGFHHIRSSDLLGKICSKIATSSGSACSSGTGKPSHVLQNMGIEKEWAETAVRFSLGSLTGEEDIRQTINILVESCAELRKNNPVWNMIFGE
ncbi:MAG: cysteine desulfurase [Saprospirales bacterium]|nr:MAG: cysteine desulfurase [Saprospirales bacterium]